MRRSSLFPVRWQGALTADGLAGADDKACGLVVAYWHHSSGRSLLFIGIPHPALEPDGGGVDDSSPRDKLVKMGACATASAALNEMADDFLLPRKVRMADSALHDFDDRHFIATHPHFSRRHQSKWR